jgi:hypothetical protein
MIDRKYGTVGRSTPAARVNHWLNAMILILLALSGMWLFHPALFFLSDLFGGGTWTRILHPWLGLALLVSFTGLFLRFWRYNLWERSDSLWMRHIGDVVSQHEENVPEVGRYNAGQKIVFWGMTILCWSLPQAASSCGTRGSANISRSSRNGWRLSSTRQQRSSRSGCGSSMFTQRSGSRARCEQ